MILYDYCMKCICPLSCHILRYEPIILRLPFTWWQGPSGQSAPEPCKSHGFHDLPVDSN